MQLIKKKKGIRGNLAIKQDLEKPYDKLEWDFIENTLSFFQISDHLAKFIMNMASSSKVSVTWNGVNRLEFVPSIGDSTKRPFIFLLFILWLEWLYHVRKSYSKSINYPYFISETCKNVSFFFSFYLFIYYYFFYLWYLVF